MRRKLKNSNGNDDDNESPSENYLQATANYSQGFTVWSSFSTSFKKRRTTNVMQLGEHGRGVMRFRSIFQVQTTVLVGEGESRQREKNRILLRPLIT